MKEFLICALSIVLCLFKGRLNHAVCDSVYIYLSNKPHISFEQAWKASGLSSNRNDYFPPEDAVLVEMKTE